MLREIKQSTHWTQSTLWKQKQLAELNQEDNTKYENRIQERAGNNEKKNP